MKKFSVIVMTSVLLAASLCGCKSASVSKSLSDTYGNGLYMTADEAANEWVSYTPQVSSGMGSADADTDWGVSTMLQAQTQAKRIYRAELNLRTTTFDETTASVVELTEAAGGYIESSALNNYGYRTVSYTLRVPAEGYRSYVDSLAALAVTQYFQESVEDVSDTYYDTEIRLQSARAKLERLNEMMQDAKKMADIIELEEAISDTQLTIDSLEGTLRNLDAKVAYSIVDLEIRETASASEQTSAPIGFSEQLSQAFKDGLHAARSTGEDIILWLAEFWWVLLAMVVVIILFLTLIVRAVKGLVHRAERRVEKRNEKKKGGQTVKEEKKPEKTNDSITE